jgi:hypothetical protein
MSTIIAGRFATQEAAASAVEALQSAGIERNSISSFYVTPPGQHGNLPVVDNPGPSAVGTEEAGPSAIRSAAAGGAVGAAVGAVIGAALDAPVTTGVGALAGAGVGAYGGSLRGAVRGAGGGEVAEMAREGDPLEHASGTMVAVRADRANVEDQAIAVLRRAGAEDLERATGDWRDGTWADFDPHRTPQLI